MIEEYQKSGEPYIDPVTGKAYNKITGQEMTKRFNSADYTLEIADVTTPAPIIDFPSLGRPAEKADLKPIEDDIKIITNALKKAEEEYKNIEEIWKNEKHILDNSPLTPASRKRTEKKNTRP